MSETFSMFSCGTIHLGYEIMQANSSSFGFSFLFLQNTWMFVGLSMVGIKINQWNNGSHSYEVHLLFLDVLFTSLSSCKVVCANSHTSYCSKQLPYVTKIFHKHTFQDGA